MGGPLVGRFLAPDVMVPGAGRPPALNRYTYVLNNPVRYTDPTGHYIPLGHDPLANRLPETGLCIRYDSKGNPVIIHGGDQLPNRVEVAFANYILSGDSRYLNGVPSSAPDFLVNVSIGEAIAEMGYRRTSDWQMEQVGSIGFGIGGTAGLGQGVSGSALFAIDMVGNTGMLFSGGGGGYAGYGAGLSLILSLTEAPSLHDLEGVVIQSGASLVAGPLIVGGEWTVQKGPDGHPIHGLNAMVGWGKKPPVPIEIHGFVEYTKYVHFFNVFGLHRR